MEHLQNTHRRYTNTFFNRNQMMTLHFILRNYCVKPQALIIKPQALIIKL